MAMITHRVRRVYQSEGVGGLVSAAASKIRKAPHQAYQEKVASSFAQRCQMLDENIPPQARSVLDIGANLGDLSAHCARMGRWTVGIEAGADLVAEANARHARVENCSFMLMHVSPDNIESLPKFDVALLLSVHHHWLMEHGPTVAGEMLRCLASRVDMAIIFEGASRRARYGEYPPDFIDNDEASVTAYLESYLQEWVGDIFTIRPLGKIANVGEREPYRWSYALTR